MRNTGARWFTQIAGFAGGDSGAHLASRALFPASRRLALIPGRPMLNIHRMVLTTALLASPLAAQTTIYSTFGPGDSYGDVGLSVGSPSANAHTRITSPPAITRASAFARSSSNRSIVRPGQVMRTCPAGNLVGYGRLS